MKTQSYLYTGPDSGITLNTGTEKDPKYLDVLLRNGQPCELPSDHPATQTLQAQGYLQATDTSGATDAPVPASYTKTTAKKTAVKDKE